MSGRARKTTSRKKILVVFGTRPEAIKLAPVIRALEAHPARFEVITCATAQHREMLDDVLACFGIEPEIDLDLMRPGQGLNELAARALAGISEVISRVGPHFTIVQGDTTTAMAAALASFHAHVPVAHVEAGLRTANRQSPFPEEINRRFISQVADLHFAPTRAAARALLREGVARGDVLVTGNTVIDALLEVAARPSDPPLVLPPGRDRYLLVTAHRRESFGRPIRRICEALARIARSHPDVAIVYPVHPNPEVQGPVHARLGRVPGVRLLEPLGYREFVACLKGAYLVVTDSGGVQEEAPALGKPVLVVRDTTERPEAIEAGVAKLVGTRVERITGAVDQLLGSPAAYARMARATNPFGDGRASGRIAESLAERLSDADAKELAAELCA